MKTKIAAIAAAGAFAFAGTAGAQTDPVSMLQQMAGAAQQWCQMGNQAACQFPGMFQQRAQYIQQAGAYCQQGWQEACQAYQQQAMEVGQMYQQMAGVGQQQQAGGYDPNNPIAPTHDQRMGYIQQWGAQNTQNFNNRMRAMDEAHQRYMSTLR